MSVADDKALAERIAKRQALIDEPTAGEPAPATAPAKATSWWGRFWGNTGTDSEAAAAENLSRAEKAAASDPLNTAGRGQSSSAGQNEADAGGVSPRGVNLPVGAGTAKKQGAAPKDPGPDGEGTYTDPTGRHRQMIDDIRNAAVADDPSNPGNVDPVVGEIVRAPAGDGDESDAEDIPEE
jgi:hypothetical protein